MRTLHLIFGLFFVVFFLGTGMYMKVHLQEKFAVDAALRYATRANHIYILLSALVNLGLGLYLTSHSGWRRVCQRLGSILLLISPVLLSLAFFLDKAQPYRPFTNWGIFTIFGGSLLHLSSAWRAGRNQI